MCANVCLLLIILLISINSVTETHIGNVGNVMPLAAGCHCTVDDAWYHVITAVHLHRRSLRVSAVLKLDFVGPTIIILRLWCAIPSHYGSICMHIRCGLPYEQRTDRTTA